MKYQKAKVKVIRFDCIEIFMGSSADAEKLADTIKNCGGFDGKVSVPDGCITCTSYAGATIPTIWPMTQIGETKWQCVGF